ncbi:hypothetical protein Glove_216g125 [Diversispora epigaea]|uniref:Uncharacterized protein n=1 Tax=Diversispora epigaea TaxID=1348612 RepID=A0A397IK23_9GLOM|nr:hypothetical protein Glove_216g125 [Diversispora epigaea]
MEGKKSRKFLNKIFHNNKKSSVSPNEWTPSFDALDLSSNNNNNYNNHNYSYTPAITNVRSERPSITRSSSIQRRYSFSNVHENGRIRLLEAKRTEYHEKMNAFTDLIQQRRGSTLRVALAPDVASH